MSYIKSAVSLVFCFLAYSTNALAENLPDKKLCFVTEEKVLIRYTCGSGNGYGKFDAIELPDGIESIEAFAFDDLSHIKELRLNKEFRFLGYVFHNPTVGKIILNDGIEEIGAHSLSGLGLKEIILPKSLRRIGKFAFWKNEIESLDLPKDTEVGAFAFADNKLTKIVVSDSMAKIDAGAFYNNEIDDVVISDGVLEIPNHLFGSNKLSQVKIPDSVIKIGNGAFEKNQLVAVQFSKNTEIIGEDAFRENLLSHVIIPSNVRLIDRNAFRENQIFSLNVSTSVSTIREGAFVDNLLTTATIPNPNTFIEDGAFDPSVTITR